MKRIGFFLIFLLVLSVGTGCSQEEKEVKRAEFAGSWYPKNPGVLEYALSRYLDEAEDTPIDGKILGVISPHAGYKHSGPIAGYSFKVLENHKFETVIVFGPTHNYYFEGVSIYPQGAFQTPLGNLEIDKKLAQEFSDLSFVQFEPQYFDQEHSLEIELPFIKKVLGDVKIVPIVFGKISYAQMNELAQKLSQLAAEKNILIVVSSDLSHRHPYQKAIEIDKNTINLIKEKKSRSLWDTRLYGKGRVCGICPIITLLEYADIEDADIKILKYANSGDTSGRKSDVVGYLSALAYKSDKSQSTNDKNTKKGEGMDEFKLTKEEKITLLKIARSTLEGKLKNGKIPEMKVLISENLKAKRGVFVTLKNPKEIPELRGCIGIMVELIPLYKGVAEYALHAALNDTRFKPVTYEELKDIEIEISVLTPFTKIESLDEIEVGKHGLKIEKGFNSGVLLPQVPLEYGWDKETYLEHLCLKAGLPPTAYKDKDTIIYKFSAIVFNEGELLKE